MAHYALIDQNNIVVQVITGKNEGEGGIDWEQYYGNIHKLLCKRTSYNTFENTHLNGGVPFRKNYAGAGYTWDEGRDAFIAPQPFSSWTLNEATCAWTAPVQQPTDGKNYRWDEPTVSWIEIISE